MLQATRNNKKAEKADRYKAARRLAEAHYQTDSGITQIFRLRRAKDQAEVKSDEPIKLLEINSNTIPSGIMPLQFDPDLASGVAYPSVIVEITPEEFEALRVGKLKLPNDWKLGNLLPSPNG